MDEPKTMEIARISFAIILSSLTSLVTPQLAFSETETTPGENGNNIPKKIYSPPQRRCLFLSYRNRELYIQLQRHERSFDVLERRTIEENYQILRLGYNPFPQDSRLSDIALQYASIGDFGQALNIVQTIQQKFPRVITLAAIAELYAEGGEKQLALETVSEAVDLAKNAEDELLTEELFFSITNVYLTVINSYLEAGEIKLASELVLLASQYTGNVKEELPKRYLLSKLAPQLSAVGKVDEALAIIEKLDINQNENERNRILEQIAINAASFGKVERALEIAQNLGGYKRNYAISQIAIKLASAGQFEQAIKIVTNFQVNQGVVMANIAKQYIEQGEINQAISTIQNIEDYCNRSEAFYEFSSLLLEEEYDLALQVANNIEATNIRSYALQAVALKLAQLERYEQATIVIQGIEVPKDKADTFIKISRSLIEAGKSEQASEFLSQALEVVESFPTPAGVYPQLPRAMPPLPRVSPKVPRLSPRPQLQRPVIKKPPQPNN